MKRVEQMQSDAASYSFIGTSRSFYSKKIAFGYSIEPNASLTRVAKGARISELLARASPGKLPI